MVEFVRKNYFPFEACLPSLGYGCSIGKTTRPKIDLLKVSNYIYPASEYFEESLKCFYKHIKEILKPVSRIFIDEKKIKHRNPSRKASSSIKQANNFNNEINNQAVKAGNQEIIICKKKIEAGNRENKVCNQRHGSNKQKLKVCN